MTKPKIILFFSVLIFFLLTDISAQPYPDQHYVMQTDEMNNNLETIEGMKLSDDGKSFVLTDDALNGYIILKPQFSNNPFNRGLPSWNGTAIDPQSSFKVLMRFPYGNGWSPWLVVGYWKENVWSVFDATSYGGGYIDYDYVKLYSYKNGWQFKVVMSRANLQKPSPSIHKLSFFVSDEQTTSSVNISAIVNDKPGSIFIPTQFIYQYGVDPVIGGSICSPTSVAMILKSYDIEVDPLQFARDTFDPYYRIFGIWPRVVQNASEFGLDGAVTRYRTWSQAREVLADGGRISMSVGLPLYEGHLIMLAGFTSDGRPIVHDPAQSNGYAYIFDKSKLSQSWFEKGGVAYTFYPAGNTTNILDDNSRIIAEYFMLHQNYPNPFNPTTRIRFSIPGTVYEKHAVSLKVFDILGREISVLLNEEIPSGSYEIDFNADSGGTTLPSGIYFAVLRAGSFIQTIKMTLVK